MRISLAGIKGSEFNNIVCTLSKLGYELSVQTSEKGLVLMADRNQPEHGSKTFYSPLGRPKPPTLKPSTLY